MLESIKPAIMKALILGRTFRALATIYDLKEQIAASKQRLDIKILSRPKTAQHLQDKECL
jgi:hypothetical protein